METFNNSDEKKIVNVFPFFACVIFLVNISVVVSFFHDRLGASETFRCVNNIT